MTFFTIQTFRELPNLKGANSYYTCNKNTDVCLSPQAYATKTELNVVTGINSLLCGMIMSCFVYKLKLFKYNRARKFHLSYSKDKWFWMQDK